MMADSGEKEIIFYFYVFCSFIIITLKGINGQQEDYNLVTRSIHLDDNWYFELVEPKSISYTYKIRPAKDFGVELDVTHSHVELVPARPIHGCAALEKPEHMRGSVALILRGECSFLSKVVNAQKAGALAVVVMDQDADNDQRMIDMIQDETDRDVDIPAFFLLGKDGHMIHNTLAELELQYAVINIPVNITGTPMNRVRLPPWSRL